jgi:hypothetical protein
MLLGMDTARGLKYKNIMYPLIDLEITKDIFSGLERNVCEQSQALCYP